MCEDEKLTDILLDDEKFMQWVCRPSAELDTYWQEYISNNPEVMDDFQLIKAIVKSLHTTPRQLSDSEKAKIWAEVKRKSMDKNKMGNRRIWLRIAAAAIVVLLVAGNIFFRTHFSAASSFDDAMQTALADSITGENIRLVVSTGKYIDIGSNKAELSYNNKGEVTVNSEQMDHANGQSQINCLMVPYGKTSTVTLCDGSKIRVNSGSKLVYPSIFDKKQREIFVEGEIFLEVMKDDGKPFIVKTKFMDVAVTGTSFDVSSYGNDKSNQVVLVSGSVIVTDKTNNESHRMQPNQKFTYNTDSHTTDIGTTDIYDHICWIYGFLHFQDERLDNVLQKIKRHYGIQMEYDPTQIADVRVTGKLDLKEDIGEVMLNIATVVPVKYEITSNCIRINALK